MTLAGASILVGSVLGGKVGPGAEGGAGEGAGHWDSARNVGVSPPWGGGRRVARPLTWCHNAAPGKGFPPKPRLSSTLRVLAPRSRPFLPPRGCRRPGACHRGLSPGPVTGCQTRAQRPGAVPLPAQRRRLGAGGGAGGPPRRAPPSRLPEPGCLGNHLNRRGERM